MKLREKDNVSQKRAHFYSKKFNRFFNAFKSKSVQRPDSYLEVCALRELEFDDTVETYQAQPASFVYELEGKITRYTPDFLIKKKDGSYEFRELKVAHRFLDPKVQDKLSVLKEFFLDRYNIPLNEWRNTDFDVGHRIDNLSTLYRYKFFNLAPFDLTKVKKLLNTASTIGDLYATIAKCNCSQALAPALIAQGHVKTDLSLKYSPTNTMEIN